jgi:hypothetical protein
MQPVYSMKAAGVRVLNVVLGALLLLAMVIVSGLLLTGVPTGVSLLFFIAFLPCPLIWLVLPRRFEIWRDRLVIVFPLVARWNLHFDTIESVEVGQWWHAYAFMGVRLASSPSKSVDVIRREANVLRRPNIVISPEGRDKFIERCNEAIERHRAKLGALS